MSAAGARCIPCLEKWAIIGLPPRSSEREASRGAAAGRIRGDAGWGNFPGIWAPNRRILGLGMSLNFGKSRGKPWFSGGGVGIFLYSWIWRRICRLIGFKRGWPMFGTGRPDAMNSMSCRDTEAVIGGMPIPWAMKWNKCPMARSKAGPLNKPITGSTSSRVLGGGVC